MPQSGERDGDRDRETETKDMTANASLDFSDSPLLTDDSFKAVLAGCASLTSLDVSGCGNLTDEALQAIAKDHALTSVNVSGCRNLTDEAIKAIASCSLRTLNVARCGKLLTDLSIQAVAASCPSLTSLNVADCKFLTDGSIEAIAAGCGSLTSLDVSRCKNITDESIKALAAGCTSLTSLNVRNCEKLTNEAIKAVATLTELSTLRIFGCRKLTDESIKALAGCAQLTTLDTTNTFRQIFKASRSDASGDPISGASISSEGVEEGVEFSVEPPAEEQPKLGLRMVDTTDAMATLKAQMDDMLQKNSTRATFCLASPSNRRATARGGYDETAFDAMVRGPTYRELLSDGTGTYEVLVHRQTGPNFQASVRVVQGTSFAADVVFSFVMSLQQADVVDEDSSLEPYQLKTGHPPLWRTDSVMRESLLTWSTKTPR